MNSFVYTSKICGSHIKNCPGCPIFNLCRENVPILKEKIDDWENRIEAKAREIYEEKKRNETNENTSDGISFGDAASRI